MNKWMIFAGLLIVFFAGMITTYFFKPNNQLLTSKHEPKVLYWVAPMDPTFRSDKPGKSPMGMDLVPVYNDGQDGMSDDSVVKISSAVENNLGVKVSKVEIRNLSRIVDTVGFVTANENIIEHIHTYTDGWVKKLNVKTTGEEVIKGQLLLELYSPSLNNAQEELLLALKNRNTSLINAGKKKLLTLGMAPSQIDSLVKERKTTERVKIYATQNGIVSRLNIREGMFVKPDTDVMVIDDLSKIWVIAEVFERQSGWLKKGQKAVATMPYLPGKTWEGVVDYVYPELDAKTHTLRVRLVFPNPNLTMKPKMYANIQIYSQTLDDVLAVPRSALIRTGEGDRVIIALGDGRYKAQSVKIGIESEDYYQIISGLKQGEMIVTSSQFLIDSESNLKASINRMQGHSHGEK